MFPTSAISTLSLLLPFLLQPCTALPGPFPVTGATNANPPRDYTSSIFLAKDQSPIPTPQLLHLLAAQTQLISSQIAKFGPESKVGSDTYVATKTDDSTGKVAVRVVVRSRESAGGAALTWSVLGYVFGLRAKDLAVAKGEVDAFAAFVVFVEDSEILVATAAFEGVQTNSVAAAGGGSGEGVLRGLGSGNQTVETV